MEPRMLDKINYLNALRQQRQSADEGIDATTQEILDEIREIAVKAGIPGYALVHLGNNLTTPF